jgi:hypothetical protein
LRNQPLRLPGLNFGGGFINGNVEVNFQKIGPEDPWPPIIKSVVLFPKSKTRRCTLFWEEDITLIQIKE